jgi:hypothetical protein
MLLNELFQIRLKDTSLIRNGGKDSNRVTGERQEGLGNKNINS